MKLILKPLFAALSFCNVFIGANLVLAVEIWAKAPYAFVTFFVGLLLMIGGAFGLAFWVADTFGRK